MIVALFTPATITRADPPAIQNAALAYWPALYHLNGALDLAGDPNLAVIYLGGVADDLREMPAAKDFVTHAAGHVKALIAASKEDACDWGMDASMGPMGLLLHLGPMRHGVTLLRADARLKGEAGDYVGAARNVAAMLRMARHVSHTNASIMNGLVEISLFNAAEEEARFWLDQDLFGEADKTEIRDATAHFISSDPFGLRASIISERDGFVGWLRRDYTPGAPLTPEMREFAYIHRADETDRRNAAALQAMIERGDSLEPHIVLFVASYDAAINFWNHPEAREALENLSREVLAGKYGPLAALLFPGNIARIHATQEKATTKLAFLRERLAN